VRALPVLAIALATGCGRAAQVDAADDARTAGNGCDDEDSARVAMPKDVCYGFADDGDGVADASAGRLTYKDRDGDGYGDPCEVVAVCGEAPAGTVDNGDDCDDSDPRVNPVATEVCDGVDNDCDGEVDEGVGTRWYYDRDGDGYGDPDSVVTNCGLPIEGAVSNGDDCGDSDPLVNPLGTEVCDGVDNDCDGKIDWGVRVPEDFALVSDAVTAAHDGETVCVQPGTYVDHIDFGGREVLVVGLDGAEHTILDGGGVGPVVRFDSREDPGATLRGFTITGGDAGEGAGVFISGADPTLDQLIVAGNTCTTPEIACKGTGIYAENSDFALTDSIVSDNVQASERTDYRRNFGAGIYLYRGHPTLTDVNVANNVVVPRVGDYYGSAEGVGMFVDRAEPQALRVTVSGNSCDGSGVPDWANYGLGVNFVDGGGTWLNTVVADNHGSGFYTIGAGMQVRNSNTPLTFTNLVVANNTAGDTSSTYAYGGGIYAYYATTSFINADIVGNSATATTDALGGHLYVSYYATASWENASFWGGAAASDATSGGGAIVHDPTVSPGTNTYSYCNFYANGDDPFYGIDILVGSYGNIAADPLYTDTTSPSGTEWDLTLSPGSALIDAGDPGYTDADGSISDIGSRGGEGAAGW
jgi:hypothetical protein